MIFKVQVLTQCEHCQGQAYLPDGETESYTGERYTRYRPCPSCQGSGLRPKWISLADLAALLEKEKCKHLHTSFNGSQRFSSGDVWDNIQEVCANCATNLDQPAFEEYNNG
jgi:hypothetical protein